MISNDITITSIETLTAFDLVTGNFQFVLDELQNITIAQSQEKADIIGKQGRKLSSLKKSKGVVISGTSGMISGGLLESQIGSKFVNKATPVLWTDYLTVSGNTAVLNYAAVGMTGNEIKYLRVNNIDGSFNGTMEQAATVSAGKFTYTPATKTITFNASEIADGTEIVVRYDRKIMADVLDNMSDQYSTKSILYIDAIGEDKCGKLYRVQFYIPKADFNGEFNLEMGDNQTTHPFEAESLAGACGSAGQLWTYAVFGVDEPDFTPAEIGD